MEKEKVDREKYMMFTYINSVKALSICYALKRLIVNEQNHTQYVNDVQAMMNHLFEQLSEAGIPVTEYLQEQMHHEFETARQDGFDPWSLY